MKPQHFPTIVAAVPVTGPASDAAIAHLVGQVYEIAPPADRRRLLEHLLKPLGILSVVAVANGIFANMRLRSSWPELHVRLEDAQQVQSGDVITLANYVQQVSIQAVDGLADLLTASPVLTGSAAAALLVSMLMQRARNRRASDLAE